MSAYATVEQYRNDTGDNTTEELRVSATLEQQSAKLRAHLGITSKKKLTDDQQMLARLLVVDAARKTLIPPTLDGFGDVSGAKSASFSANGFQAQVAVTNPSGSAYFDRDTLNTLKKLLGKSQRIGIISPY